MNLNVNKAIFLIFLFSCSAFGSNSTNKDGKGGEDSSYSAVEMEKYLAPLKSQADLGSQRLVVGLMAVCRKDHQRCPFFDIRFLRTSATWIIDNHGGEFLAYMLYYSSPDPKKEDIAKEIILSELRRSSIDDKVKSMLLEVWMYISDKDMGDIADNFESYRDDFGENAILLTAVKSIHEKAIIVAQRCLESASRPESLTLDKAYGRAMVELLWRSKVPCPVRDEHEFDEFLEGGLGNLVMSPRIMLEKKYKNLEAKEAKEAKVPFVIHHIWLTTPKAPREVRSQDLENALRIKKLYETSDKPWTHVLWTNNPDLIPQSKATLEAGGIEVRSIQDFSELPLLYLVNELAEKQLWGKASDILRYSVLYLFGGIYLDINYQLNRLLNSEAHKFNFFTTSWGGYYIENYFFGASPAHPVIERLLYLVERNLVVPPKYIAIYDSESRESTDLSTANPTFVAYYYSANQDGNIDVIFPASQYSRGANEDYGSARGKNATGVFYWKNFCPHGSDAFNEMMRTLFNHELCGADELFYGNDSEDGKTWLKNAAT